MTCGREHGLGGEDHPRPHFPPSHHPRRGPASAAGWRRTLPALRPARKCTRRGRSVSSLVDELLTAGAPAEQLFKAVAAAGIPIAQLAATTGITFDVRERLTLPVDEQIPVIVPASFVGGSRPGGVIDISYVIDLDRCLGSALPEPVYTDLIRAIAEMPAIS